jgi:polysaccharide biosynthesis/export protein
MRRLKKSGLLIAVLAPVLQALCACSSLPESGPSAQDVLLQQGTAEQGPRYEVVDIDAWVVEALRRRGYDSFSAHFGDHNLSAEPVIGVGDSVTVTIWEASSGGLFSAPLVTDKISAGSNAAMIPAQGVGRDGGSTVPYAGTERRPGPFSKLSKKR